MKGRFGSFLSRVTGTHYTHTAIVVDGKVCESTFPRAKCTPINRYAAGKPWIVRYVPPKGFSKWFGALGVLGIVVGLIILLLLPTRTAQAGSMAADTSTSNLPQLQADEGNDVANETRVCVSQNPYEPSNGPNEHLAISTSRLKPAIAYGLVFLLGCAVVVLPMFAYASAIHADETARGEPTTASGIQMFLGVIFAPIGGIVACFLFYLFRRSQKA